MEFVTTSFILVTTSKKYASHSFCPGPELEHRLSRELIASVTARTAAANWLITLGALGSAESALAARSSFEDKTGIVLR